MTFLISTGRNNPRNTPVGADTENSDHGGHLLWCTTKRVPTLFSFRMFKQYKCPFLDKGGVHAPTCMHLDLFHEIHIISHKQPGPGNTRESGKKSSSVFGCWQIK